jgi:asparagine synthase (glutamine-hydrolysing)
MCGIVTILSSKLKLDQVQQSLRTMNLSQEHRGPDDSGVLVEAVNDTTILGLGHQRLSVLDLTPDGHQPMVSPCGRYSLIYNGEIYNYIELAEYLGEDPILALSSGDTAVVLAALVRWGTSAFNKFNGMWSLVFYDRVEQQLIVSRDRMGIKPLYVYNDSHSLIFASEVKTILKSCGRPLRLRRDAIAKYLQQSITNDQDRTFFEEIHAVPPGSFAKVSVTKEKFHLPEYKFYWKHPYAAGTSAELAEPSEDNIRETFLDAVNIRLRSDVPVGVLLSGGIDSSAILGAANEAGRVDTITALSVVSDDVVSNEEPFIDLMATHIGCDVIKLNIDLNPNELLQDLSDVCWYNDQPIVSLSAVAHRKLMEKARDLGLVVLLTGQGADEQLGGYNKFLYFYLADCLRNGQWHNALKMIGGCLRQGTIISEFTLREAKRYLPFLRNRIQVNYFGEFLNGANLADIGGSGSYREREWLDICRYSIPILLHYEDRMSMSWSREMRVPFLDYRLVELFAAVNPKNKLENGWTKAIFRRSMEGILPSQIQWRKDKKGFSVPEAKWIREEFQAHFKEMFYGSMYAVELGIVNQKGIQNLYKQYLNGNLTVNYKEIFNVYCLEIWLRRFEQYIHRN